MNDPNAISYSSQKVFISYSHDSLEHAEWVASFANDLRGAGVEANIDQFVTGAYPDEGWDTWESTLQRNEINDGLLEYLDRLNSA